jgi:signal transduction histidine kinase
MSQPSSTTRVPALAGETCLDAHIADGVAGPPVNILLVDDQPKGLIALAAMLEAPGHQLVVARSGVEALRLLLEADFAVILMDVQMPEMDGFETAELIRQRDRSRHTPIIFLTAYERTDVQMFKGYSLGAVDYLCKPIVSEVLRSKVRVLVDLHRTTEAVRRQADLLREGERREHEQRLAEERQRWEMETLRQEAARDRAIAENLAEADRRKDEFLAMLGHELRNPLAPILNALHIMGRRGTDASILQDMRDLVERQVKHMSRLVDDLLDVSRITRGKVQLLKERLNLADVVARAVEGARALIEGKRHRLEVVLPREPLWLEADPTRLEQVLANLLANAAKYMEEGGRVWLTVERHGETAVVRVRDLGLGIPPEVLPRVFDLFMQGEQSLDRSQGGLGIGLTLVRSLVELHGGSVSAHSEGPGRGSEFVVRLPAASTPGQPCPKSPAPKGKAGRARRVLVVDDIPDVADSLRMVLGLDGHDVRIAADGRAALEVAQAWPPEVVLLDLGLPGMSGLEVARQLRSQADLESVFLVAMTGYGQEQDRQRCHEAGFDLHLVKPVDPAVLREMLAFPNLVGS